MSQSRSIPEFVETAYHLERETTVQDRYFNLKLWDMKFKKGQLLITTR